MLYENAIARAAAQEQRELSLRKYAYRGDRTFLDLSDCTSIRSQNLP